MLPRDFCTFSFDKSMYSQNRRSCGSISLKTVLIFHKNFLSFRSDTIENQSLINLISYRCKIYLCCSWWFWGHLSFGRGCCSLLSTFIIFLIQYDVVQSKMYIIKSYFRRYFIETYRLCIRFIFCEVFINHFFSWPICNFRKISMQILEMFFPLL